MKDIIPFQMGVLTTLLEPSLDGLTAPEIALRMGRVASGVRTRLHELSLMNMVTWQKPEDQRHRAYQLTRLGWDVVQTGPGGMEFLRMLRPHYQAMEHERAIELAPIKDKWERLIRNHMSMMTATRSS